MIQKHITLYVGRPIRKNSPQTLVVRRLDVLLVVRRLAEQLRAVLLRAALLLPLPQVLPEHFLRLDLEFTERAGESRQSRRGGSALLLDSGWADLEMEIHNGH